MTFSGGEALLRPDVFELISYARSLSMSVGLVSNGRALDKQKLDSLKELDVQLSISVPGIDTFAQHTGINNIEHVFGLLEYARDIGLFVCANVTVTSVNIDELYETVALPLIHGANYILLNRFLPGGRGLGHEELIIDKGQTNTMLQITEEVLSRANREGHVGTEIPYCIIENPEQYHHLKISNSCGAAQSFFVVDPSGYIKVCNISDQRLVHVRDIDQLSDHPYWQMFQTQSYLPKACKACKHNTWCVGGCRESARLYTGDIHSFDPCLGEPLPEPISDSLFTAATN